MTKKQAYPTKVFRRFLNNPKYHDLAGVRAIVEVDEYGHHEASISISDCRRTINLDFTCFSDAELRNSLKKLQTLKDAVVFTEEHLQAAWEAKKTFDKAKKKK